MESIIEYVNNNKLIFVIIIIGLLLIIAFLYKNDNCNKCTVFVEKMDNINSNTNSVENDIITAEQNNSSKSEQVIPESKPIDEFKKLVIGSDIKIKLRATAKGDKYHMAILKRTDCTNILETNTKDCLANVAVLIKESMIDKLKQQYTKVTSFETSHCIDAALATCNGTTTLAIGSKPTSETKCTAESYEKICQVDDTFIDQFVVTTNEKREFFFKAKQQDKIINGQIQKGNSSFLSQNLFLLYGSSSNMLCFDGIGSTDTTATKLIVLPNCPTDSNKNNGIVSSKNDTSPFKLIIQFKNTKTMTDVYNNSVPIETTMYVGYCDATNICTSDKENYLRLCLYKDIDDPHIIAFEPIIG
jgi:hypothetical protein